MARKKKRYPPPPPGYEVQFVTRVTDPKTGQVRYAAEYGVKAFPILVKVK